VKSAAPKTSTPPLVNGANGSRIDPRTARLPKPTVPVAVAPALPAVVAEPVPVAAAPAPPPPAPEPAAAEAQTGPVGPFFELRQVDQPPQVTSRVEPDLPDGLQSGAINEIVIARVLVSQSGHPSLVSLLRRSKAGPELDAAVINAVKRWSFTPASRRGEAVSCFMNVAVTVRRTE
jgi:protein TonB